MQEGPVKSILISQPSPEGGKSPYDRLVEHYGVKVDFRPFIQVDPIPYKELRNERINPLDFTAVIFNSRNAVDNYFRLVEEMKIELPPDMKYFCINEGTALYIQKYIVLRKRKVFFGPGREPEFLELIKNHPKEKYFFPCSNIRKESIPNFLTKHKLDFTELAIYKTVTADLSDLEDVYYDIIVFFSPADIKSLFINFPEFKQNKTRIAGFGKTTALAIDEADLLLNIPAPTPEAPSMVAALEQYIKKVN